MVGIGAASKATTIWNWAMNLFVWQLPLAEAERARLVSHVGVADAICYVFGALGVIVFCGTIGPRLLGIDLVVEAEKLEASLGIDRTQSGVV